MALFSIYSLWGGTGHGTWGTAEYLEVLASTWSKEGTGRLCRVLQGTLGYCWVLGGIGLLGTGGILQGPGRYWVVLGGGGSKGTAGCWVVLEGTWGMRGTWCLCIGLGTFHLFSSRSVKV